MISVKLSIMQYGRRNKLDWRALQDYIKYKKEVEQIQDEDVPTLNEYEDFCYYYIMGI